MQTAINVAINDLLNSSHGIVSYKSLQVALDCSLSDSKNNLERFTNCKQDYQSTRCLSGLACNKDSSVEWLIQLSDKGKLSSRDRTFLGIPDSFVYSIQKEKSNSSVLANFDLLCCSNRISKNQINNAMADSLHTEQPETITAVEMPASKSPMKNVQQNLPQKKILPSKRPSSRKSPVKKGRPVNGKLQVNLLFKKSESPIVREEKRVPTEIPPDPFADSEDEQHSDEDIMLSASSELSKRRRICFSSDDDDIDNGGELNEKKLPLETMVDEKSHSEIKSETKIRKKEQDDSKVPVVNNAPSAKGRNKSKIAQSVSNSKEITLSFDVKNSPTKPTQISQKSNYQRNQVVKTFLDDDGFLITEKVWEDVEVPNVVESSTEKKEESLPGSSASNVSPQKSKDHRTTKPKATKQSTLTFFLKS